MAFKQISSIYFLADKKEDLVNIPTRTMGAECFVIKDAMEYKQTSTGEWYPQTISVASNGETSTFEQIQSDWNQDDKTAIDYIKNKPFGIEVEIGEQVNTEDFYLSGASLFKLVFEDGLVDYCEYKDEIEPGTGGGSNVSLISLINKNQYFGNVNSHDADWWVTPPKEMFILNSFNNKKISFEQIQSDWEQMDNTAVDYIKNKPFGISYDEKIEGVWTPLGMVADFRYELSFPGIDTLDIGLGGPVIKFAGPYYPTYCYYDSSTETFYDIDTGEIYRTADSFFHAGQAWALTNFSKKTIDFIDLPIKQLDWLSTVNPTMDPAVTSEGSTEKTGQEAYDYAVSVNNTLLQLIESYNGLIGQLNHKGYVNQI